ncbi:MAG: hypothetical protein IJD21_00420 [Oscillospiraceae bacterium]|nr:hypothetical protein [Oscillospiraceae bacterium]
MEYLTKALEVLDKGVSSVKGQKERAMAPAVAKQLKSFCKQDLEFAQAVVQGGSFADCMAAVAKGIGSSISDLDAYRKAVRFYFPGADIEYQMTIKINPYERDSAVLEGKKGIVLNFSELFF